MKWARPSILALVATVAQVWPIAAAGEPAPTVSYTVLDGGKGCTASLRSQVMPVNCHPTRLRVDKRGDVAKP